MNGVTFYCCIGKPALKLECNSTVVRVIIGPVSVALLFRDLEVYLAEVTDALRFWHGEALRRAQGQSHCKDCGAETTPGAGAARCPECWDSRCGAGKDGGIDG